MRETTARVLLAFAAVQPGEYLNAAKRPSGTDAPQETEPSRAKREASVDTTLAIREADLCYAPLIRP